ncbi:MAG TPA: SRPBCC family protein [Mycobacteriales bacterium]|nr:SRPBCC family protein [Mycobacteriales bacterium]
MADQSTQSIVIDAPPAAIMAVIGDFAAYPEWAGSVKATEVLSTGADGRPAQVKFMLDAGPIKDEYVLDYTWSGDQRVDWNLVRANMQKSQQGSYVLVPRGSSTEVTYHLAVDLMIPMLGMLKRKAEKVIMDTALKELKKRVES